MVIDGRHWRKLVGRQWHNFRQYQGSESNQIPKGRKITSTSTAQAAQLKTDSACTYTTPSIQLDDSRPTMKVTAFSIASVFIPVAAR